MKRELAIALRARVTWLVATLAALLVGHGFVLATDLFSASSRSALSSLLQTREMDPLQGIIRPTLGGVDLVLSLFGPVVAAHSLASEKERRTYGALCLAVGSSWQVITRKTVASATAVGTLALAPLPLFAAFAALGGHVDALETAVALAGVLLHLTLVTTVTVAAAAWTRTFAQAVTLGILGSLTSWAIDAADGFAALAWLGGASAWSIEQRLLPFQHGVVTLGCVFWLALGTITAFGVALVGGSFARPARKRLASAVIVGVGLAAMSALGSIRRGFDWSEERRASLPPAVVKALRAIPAPIQLEIFLDRDDSRRRQVESDALSKVVLARPDVVIRTPLDQDSHVLEGQRGSAYGTLVVHVGSGVRQTRSTSRRELVTLIFDAAGQPLPDWRQAAYPGFPVIVEGSRRWWLGLLAYLGVPLGLALAGFTLTHRRATR